MVGSVQDSRVMQVGLGGLAVVARLIVRIECQMAWTCVDSFLKATGSNQILELSTKE